MIVIVLIVIFGVVNGRFEIKEEDGKQTLVIKDLKLDDPADFTCKIGDRETSAKLQVDEGMYCTCGIRCTFCYLFLPKIVRLNRLCIEICY